MDAEALAHALNELAARERGDDAVVFDRVGGRRAGVLVPRTDCALILQAAAAVVRWLAPGRVDVFVFPGDEVDVRCRVIEHHGDCLVVEHSSLRGRERSIVGPSSISKVYPVAPPNLRAGQDR